MEKKKRIEENRENKKNYATTFSPWLLLLTALILLLSNPSNKPEEADNKNRDGEKKREGKKKRGAGIARRAPVIGAKVFFNTPPPSKSPALTATGAEVEAALLEAVFLDIFELRELVLRGVVNSPG